MRVVTTGQMRVEEQVAAPQTDRRLPRRPRRWIGIGLLLGLLLLGASPWMWRSWVEARYAGQTYAVEPAVTAIPAALGPEPQVAVVFGARVYRSGRLSPMLQLHGMHCIWQMSRSAPSHNASCRICPA